MSSKTQRSMAAIVQVMREVAAERQAGRLTALTAAAGVELEDARRQHPEDWPRLVTNVRALPGFATFLEDPFTRHAYMRPRGYAGDAGLLDFIYRGEIAAPRRISGAGRAIFRAMTAAAAPTGVRNRQSVVGRLADGVALEQGRSLRIASLGCGHLAEAEKMEALAGGSVEQLWAIDQDHGSLVEVKRRFPHPAVVPVRASINEFLRGHAAQARDLDFFFASGLFDYVQDRAACRLVRRMFDRLRPGGVLLVANFLTGVPDRGYMEAVMDWWLLYRSETEIAALDAEIDPARIAAKRTFVEPAGNIGFLELRRA